MRTRKEAAQLVETATRRWAEDAEGELAEMEENLLRHVRADSVESAERDRGRPEKK